MSKNKIYWIVDFIVLAVLVFGGGFFWPARAEAETIIKDGTISSDTVWTQAQSPYIIDGDLYINPGVTLTIEPGVTVKLKYFFSSFFVSGKLNALGTASSSIYFTSFKDDSQGGDSNNDGTTTLPVAKNWGSIYLLPGSTSNFSQVILSYAGNTEYAGGINNVGGLLSVSNSKFSSSTIGINQQSGTATVTDSEIFGNDFGFYLLNGTGNITQSKIYNNSGYGIYSPFGRPVMAKNNWWGDASGPYNPTRNPTGKGNAVSKSVDFIPWLEQDPALPPPTKPNPVIIVPGILGSAEKNGQWIIDPILHTYDDLIDTLKQNGYTENKDLFVFPYDWRNSNVATAILLRARINEVKDICQCGKVDLVAHSMGGLVARQYIESNDYQNDIDKLIFLGTPHLGAPKIYLMWEGAEVPPNDFSYKTIKFLLSQEAKHSGYSSLFNYVKNRPISSVQGLLPVYDYLKDKNTNSLRSYPNNYPQNQFLENLKNNTAKLLNSGLKITNIVGDIGTSTISLVRVIPSSDPVLWADGYPDGFNSATSTDHGLELGIGDGTVPLSSAEFINDDLMTVNSEHNTLPDEAEGLVYHKLTGQDTTKLAHTWWHPLPNVPLLIIKILSPVDMQVIAPDGRRIGKDFTTGQEINEITGAFYSGFQTDNEYLTIPNPLDGPYKIVTQGTGNGGAYTVATGYLTSAGTAEKDFTGQSLPNMLTPIILEVSSTSAETLEIKPEDVMPPVMEIISPENKDYLRSDLIKINATSSDAGTGVFSFGLSLDGRSATSGEEVDLFFKPLGEHLLIASSTDFVGNLATSSVLFRLIVTPQSAIFAIERAYALGWIKTKAVKESLINKLKAAIKLEKKIETIEEKLPGKPKISQKITKLVERIDNVLGRLLLAEAKLWHNNQKINDQAYQILTEDIEWLLDN